MTLTITTMHRPATDLDQNQHCCTGDNEVDKLPAKSDPSLPEHPARERTVRRYPGRSAGLAESAPDQLDTEPAEPEAELEPEATATANPKPPRLHEQRHNRVVELLRAAGAASVLDLGCGSGKLIQKLLRVGQFTRIAGVEPDVATLQRAAKRLRLDEMTPKQRERIELFQGGLTYHDERFASFDAAVLVEVIEHIDPPRHATVEQVVFGAARPRTVIVTTPNQDYNCLFPSLPAGDRRHPDHRFEWTRAEFRAWAQHVAAVYDYSVRIEPLGPRDERYGGPSQVGVFNALMR